MTRYRVEHAAGGKTRADFFELPFALYRDDHLWVPPNVSEQRRTLDPRVNPYFSRGSCELFVCYRDGAPVARACAVINRAHWDKFKTKAAFFGFFECIDDVEAAGRLFDALSSHVRAEGAEVLEGPFNPNHYSNLGLQRSAFDVPPVFSETYNPAYYVRLFHENGLAVLKTMSTWGHPDYGAYLRAHDPMSGPPAPCDGFRVRPFSLLHAGRDLECMREVFNEAFAENWHFLPLSRAEYRFNAPYFLLLTYPKLIAIIEYGNEPVGVGQFVLEINPLLRELDGGNGLQGSLGFLWGRRKLRDLVGYAIGIKPAYRASAAAELLVDYAKWLALGYRGCYSTWTNDDDPSCTRMLKHLGISRRKEFAVYQRHL
jgi:hypothetical protein